MEVFMLHMSMVLLTLACLTVTQGQYYDFFQELQQILQQYPQPTQFFSPYNSFNKPLVSSKHEIKKKTEDQERWTKKPPTHQYEYVFATTTAPKPSRKPTKSNSSQSSINKSSNRNYNTDIIFSDYFTPSYDITTKRNRVTPNNRLTTTTVKPIDNYYINSATTEKNVYSNINLNNYDRPNAGNNFNNNKNINVQNMNIKNDKNDYNNNYEKPTKLIPNFASNNNPNRKTQNNREYYSSTTPKTINNNRNENNFGRPTFHRNPNVAGIDVTQNNRENNYRPANTPHNNKNTFSIPTNHRNPNVAGISNPYRPTENNGDRNYGSSIVNNNYNRENFNLFNPGFNHNPANPVVNRPGVKPTRVDINQPPITNKPVTDLYDRPNQGYGNKENMDKPEIIIGPDEEDMSERQKRRYVDIAEKMCDHYKSLNVKEVAALPLLPSAEPVEFNVTSCVPIIAPLVIGGKVVTINEFPHMALVGWKKAQSSGYSWKCGASLISDQYLLTAGHCTFQDTDSDAERWVGSRPDDTESLQTGPPQAVQLGSSYHNDPSAVVVRIAAVIRHPKYKQRRSYFDLALIKLVRTVKFTDVIRPACLGEPPADGENIIATGWGRTEFGGDHSEELRSVSLKVWNMAECRDIWGTSLRLPNGPTPESHMCAGEKSGGKDTCQGDSGGPAQIQDGCVWRVVGVTSFGRSCGAPNTPALYSVLKIPFIVAQVFGDRQQDSYNENQDRRNPLDYRGGNQGTRRYDDRRQSYTDGFASRPIYVVNNFKRE